MVVENFAPGVMARAGSAMTSCRDQSEADHVLDFARRPIRLRSAASPVSTISAPPMPASPPHRRARSRPGATANRDQRQRDRRDRGHGVGFALLHRERTGEGQYIDCSLVDTYFNMHEVNVPKTALRGEQFQPGRMGSLHPDGGPTGVFRCRNDEYIAIMVMPLSVAANAQSHEHAGARR